MVLQRAALMAVQTAVLRELQLAALRGDWKAATWVAQRALLSTVLWVGSWAEEMVRGWELPLAALTGTPLVAHSVLLRVALRVAQLAAS
jgi:hypothetical protein